MTTLTAVFFFGQRIAIYSFFLIRLYGTFKSSIFEIKKQCIIIVVLMIITMIPAYTSYLV